MTFMSSRKWPTMTEKRWLHGNDIRTMLRFLAGKVSDRKLLLFAVACCRRIWPYLDDQRTRWVVERAELFADGLTSVTDLQTAGAAAMTAWKEAMAAADTAKAEAQAAGHWSKATAPEWARLRKLAWAADTGTHWTKETVHAVDQIACTAREVAGDVSNMALEEVEDRQSNLEREAHVALLRHIVGNPFHPQAVDDYILAWNDMVIPKIAQGIYEEGDFQRLPILADALEEAGCTNEDILTHCRDPKQVHVKGCWVVDLLLGKE